MKITINGKETILNTNAVSLRSLLDAQYPKNYNLAVELNGHVIDDNNHEKTFLNNGDRIEVLIFMGGG